MCQPSWVSRGKYLHDIVICTLDIENKSCEVIIWKMGKRKKVCIGWNTAEFFYDRLSINCV